MWLDLGIALSCGGAGLACGWVMHAVGGFGNSSFLRQAAIKSGEIHPRDILAAGNEQAVVAERLKAAAHAMAADVDAHQSRVQAVNNSLSENDGKSPESVFAAINQLIEANELMQAQLQAAQDRIQEQSMQIESAERRAETDALTRIPNRGAFDRHFSDRHACGPAQAGSLAVLDVDNFKRFNDVYGHRAGDEVLRIVANVLHVRLKSFGIVARFGGEEFAIVLDNCPIEKARELVEDARIAIGARDIQFEDKRLRVTASVGVAELLPSETKEAWLERADVGLYRSKEAGRDCGHWMNVNDPVKIVMGAATTRPTDGGSRRSGSGVAAAPAKPVAKPEKPAKPDVFSALPDQETLAKAFDDIRSRTQSNVSIYVMAIGCHADAGKPAIRSLLQVVRATLRSVDRIGYMDDRTLLVCMPSADSATANARAIQISRSAASIGFGEDIETEKPLAIGISRAAKSEEFDNVVQRANGLMHEASESSGYPIQVEGFPLFGLDASGGYWQPESALRGTPTGRAGNKKIVLE